MKMDHMHQCTLRCVHIAVHAGWLECLMRPTQPESTQFTLTPAGKEITHILGSSLSSHAPGAITIGCGDGHLQLLC